MVGSQDIQDSVEALGSRLGLPILVEDARFQPLWWSAQDAVDGHRLRSILQRTVHPAAVAMVKKLKLATAAGPVRTPAVPAAEMLPRWCVPLRSGPTLLGYLWVLDRDGTVTEDDLVAVTGCAAQAGAYLAQTAEHAEDHDRRLAELLTVLAASPAPDAVRELVALEHLDADARVVVEAPGRTGGWDLAAGLSAHVVAPEHDGATSGAPVAVADLHLAVYRALKTRQVVRAGGQLDRPSWDRLGAWHLIIAAPGELIPADIHPGADRLAGLPRPDLLTTARTTLELGGDVAAAAAVLHVHRTTLYYRLDRITEVTGVDVRTSPDRFDLQMALRLAAFRSVASS